MLPKDIYILIFGICEYVTAHGIGGGVAHVSIKSLGMRRVFCSIQVGCYYPSGLLYANLGLWETHAVPGKNKGTACP